MGQSQSNEQNNEYFNLLITTLVQSKSEESVRGAMYEFKENVQFQHGLIPDYLSDIIVIISLIFMIALIVFLKVTLHFVRKEMADHKKNCQRSTDKNERTWVRIDRIRIKNVSSSNIRKRNNNNKKSTGKSKNKTSSSYNDLICHK